MPDNIEWLLPVLIYFARICDVSIGTFRMLMVIWLMQMSHIHGFSS